MSDFFPSRSVSCSGERAGGVGGGGEFGGGGDSIKGYCIVVAAAASAGGKSAGVSSFRFERAVKNFGVATLRGVECLGVDAAFLARIVPLTQPTCLPTVALARDDMDLFSGAGAARLSSNSRWSDWSPAKPDSELATDDVDDRPRPVRPRSTSANVRVGLSAPRGG